MKRINQANIYYAGAPHAEVTYQGIGLVQARLVKCNL